MITIGQEQRLGHKAFMLLLSKKLTIGIVFLIIALIITAFSNSLLHGVTGAITTVNGVSGPHVTSTAVSLINYLILVIFGIGIIGCLIGFIVAWLEYSNYTYRLDEFDLIIKKGILEKRETAVPYRQIQGVDIDRTLSLQLLGLSRLVVMTAGTEEKDEKESADVVLEPLDKNIAEELQQILERKIGVQVVEDESKADKEESVNL